MILGAGGKMLIGRGYTRAPSYAFQMTSLVEMAVLEKQILLNLCSLFSVLLITLLGLFFLLNDPRWGWVTEGRKTVVWCGVKRWTTAEICLCVAAWKPFHQQHRNPGPTPQCRCVFWLHHSQKHTLRSAGSRLCGAKRVRRVVGEREGGMTFDRGPISWIRSIYYRTSVSWFTQDTRKLPSNSLNVHVSITVAEECIKLLVSKPKTQKILKKSLHSKRCSW